jgi:hypothetical protein
MDPILLIGTVGFPIVLAVGGLIAWRAIRAQQEREAQPATWRDDSLDDWRRERDRAIEAEREQRQQRPPGEVHPASESREGDQGRKTHTRLGG